MITRPPRLSPPRSDRRLIDRTYRRPRAAGFVLVFSRIRFTDRASQLATAHITDEGSAHPVKLLQVSRKRTPRHSHPLHLVTATSVIALYLQELLVRRAGDSLCRAVRRTQSYVRAQQIATRPSPPLVFLLRNVLSQDVEVEPDGRGVHGSFRGDRRGGSGFADLIWTATLDSPARSCGERTEMHRGRTTINVCV